MEEQSTKNQYNPGKEVKEYIASIYDDMDVCVDARTQSYPELHDMTPMEFVDESRMRAHGYVPNDNVDEYGNSIGANVFFNKTGQKIDIIAAFVAAQRPRAEISARGRNSTHTDKRIATIERNAYDYFMDKEHADTVYLDWNKETLETGTGFIMDYYDYQEQEFKIVTKKNWETGEQEYEKKTRVIRDECRSKVVPFEQLYWPTFYETDFQNYPFIIYQEVVLYDVAKASYGKFKNWKYVKKKGAFNSKNADEGEMFFWKRWQERVEGANFVEILHRYDRLNDRHDILINGVLMTEMDNPMLYDHKMYPFVPQYYRKIKGFILGMSLPMKIMYAQDTFNELMNANINRSRSSAHVAFLSSLESQIENDSVGTWEIIRTDDDANLRELRVESVKQGDVAMTDLISKEIDDFTVQNSMSGEISGETATAIINAIRQSTQNLGPQMIYVYDAAQTHAEMRLKNILQFFFNKNLKGEAFDMKEINIEDAKLSDGQKGIRIIRVVDSKDKIPAKHELEEEMMKGVVEQTNPLTGEKEMNVETNYEIVYITPDDIADVVDKIRIVPSSSLPKTDALERALLIETINTGASAVLSQYPDFKALWRHLLESSKLNPDDFTLPDDQLQQAQNQEMQQAGLGPNGEDMGGQVTQQLQEGQQGPGIKQLMGMVQ